MKFVYFNDTGREVLIHPATKIHGTVCAMENPAIRTTNIYTTRGDVSMDKNVGLSRTRFKYVGFTNHL